jgi:tetratricopeptide (TPR) repeat protein
MTPQAALIYITSAPEDREFVEQLAGDLLARRLPVWGAAWAALFLDWAQEPAAARQASTHLLVVLSPQGVCDERVSQDIQTALNHERAIVCVVFRPCVLPSRLRYRPQADFTTQEYGAALEDLAGHLEDTRLTALPESLRDTQSAAALLAEGDRLYEAGNYQGAVEVYSQVIVRQPDNGRAYARRAHAHRQDRAHEPAMQDYQCALAFEPNLAEAYNGRGNLHYARKDYPAAIADYSEAIHLDPAYAHPYFNRGTVYNTTRQLDLALEDFNAAIELLPNDPDSYHNRALLYERLRRFDLADKDYAQVLELDPMHALTRAKKRFQALRRLLIRTRLYK